jgi:hypothetical protein
MADEEEEGARQALYTQRGMRGPTATGEEAAIGVPE